MTDHSIIVNEIEKEYKQLEESNAWNQVYQRVRSEGTYNLPCTAAKSGINKNLNRYRDVLPYDHTRIVISGSNTDYINASLVKVECVNRSYILAQGPLPQTSPHFWLMVWQQRVKGIIMLNKIIEKNQIKCHQYWPVGNSEGGEDSLDISTVGLRVDLLNVDHHSHYNYTTLRLTEVSTGVSRTILHFHYTTWPDFGVPQSPEAFYKFLNVVRASGVLEPDVGPSIVHCSAGIGRSGTFCLVDSFLMMLSRGLCSSDAGKVLEVLLDMRKQRMGLIQTPDQLRFSYQAIVYGAHKMGEVNGKDPCEESSSEEPSLVEDLPPQPPPRTDSLTRSMIESQLAQELDGEGSDTGPEDNDNDDNSREINSSDSALVEPGFELRTTGLAAERKNHSSRKELYPNVKTSEDGLPPLPAEPPSRDSSGPESSPATSPNNANSIAMETELRQRKRRDRQDATAAKVKDMVEKQRANEIWEARKRTKEEGDEEEDDDQNNMKRTRLSH